MGDATTPAMDQQMNTHTGSCLCGGIQFSIRAPLGPIQVCHCVQCRKAQGTALATNVPVNARDFTLAQGADLLSSYESSPGKHRVFCKVCGSPLYSHRDALPGVLRIRVGLVNESIDAPLEAHFYAGSKANWWPINDSFPKFDTDSASSRIS